MRSIKLTLLLLLTSCSLWAQTPLGPYIVQAAENTGSGTISSLTCTFGQNVVSGNTILVGYSYEAGTSPSLADTRSTSYSNAQSYTDAAGIKQVIASGSLGSGGANTVTLSITSGTFVGIVCTEVANSNGTKDACATGKDFSGSPATARSNSVTAANNGEFLFAFAAGLQSAGLFTSVSTPFEMFAQTRGNDSRAGAWEISGTNGSYSATFGNSGNTAGSVILCAFGPGTFTVTSPSVLPDAVLNSAYDYFLTSNGGTGSLTWAITSGSLQAGLSLNTSTGEISGTPTNGGNHTITFQATDGAAVTASKSVTLKVTTAFSTATFVQGASQNASSKAFASNVVSGNMILVGCQNSPVTVSAAASSYLPPSDSVSTPYYLVDVYWYNFGGSTGNALWLWYGIAPSSAANTVTCNGGASNRTTIAELSGVQYFLDVHALTTGSGATGSTTITSSSLTPLMANSILYTAGFVYGGTATTINSPFTHAASPGNGQTDMGYDVITTVTGYTSAFATASATDGHWVIDLLALRPASNGTTATETFGGAKSNVF